jgi:hypothetical protein
MAAGGREMVLEKTLDPDAGGGKVRGGLIEHSSVRRIVWNSGCIESSYIAYVRAIPEVS